MAQPTITWLYNNSSNDGSNTGNAFGGTGSNSSNWVVIDRANDSLLFRDAQQSDGDSNSGSIYLPIIPNAGTIEAPKTFINDNSNNIFDQVPLAGTTDGGQSGGDTRYVFAIYFSGATASIPQLECWNDSNHNTSDNALLGGGTAANSTIRAISTTNAVPGSATWAGTPLAGAGNVLALDSAALGSAKNVYFNIKQVIASTLSAQSSTNLVLTMRYTYT